MTDREKILLLRDALEAAQEAMSRLYGLPIENESAESDYWKVIKAAYDKVERVLEETK